jgi:hypothetical protein
MEERRWFDATSAPIPPRTGATFDVFSARHHGRLARLFIANARLDLDQQKIRRISSRTALRKVLFCIVDDADRAESCSVRTLLEAGWPGERVAPEPGANRVYVSVSALRKMGLRMVIERCDQGYRLAPGVCAERRRAELGPAQSSTTR